MNVFFVLLVIGLFSCGGNGQNVVDEKSHTKADDSGTGLKDTIVGQLDGNNLRHGKWVSYDKAGIERSVMTYTHGSKEGFSIVKHPNGVVFYRGEYRNNEKVGLWSFYNDKGELVNEINYENE